MSLASLAVKVADRFFGSRGQKLREGVRLSLQHVSRIEDGGLLIVRLPTGYGKSLMSMFIASAVVEVGRELGLARVIHVLPLRSIVQDLYTKARRYASCGLLGSLRQNDIGYQASIYLDEGYKSELFLSKLVYTTLDSYVINFSKITPLRSRWASYHAARTAIYTALTIFDEAHLFAEVDATKAYTSLITIVRKLLEAKLPVIVMTATMPDSFVESLIAHIQPRNCTVISMDWAKTPSPSVGPCENVVFQDSSWEPPSYDTQLKQVEDPIKDIVSLAKEEAYNGRVLIVRNKVHLAIKTYKQLIKEGLPRERVALLHGRLTYGNRDSVLSRITCGRTLNHKIERRGCEDERECRWDEAPNIIVSTQVIEAGVDFSVDTLISDIAPLAQIVQRVGRVARHERKDRTGKVFIVYQDGSRELYEHVYDVDITRRTLEILKRRARGGSGDVEIEWRVPNSQDESSYFKLLNDVYSEYFKMIKLDYQVMDSLEKIDEVVTLHRRDADVMEEKLCGFVRESVMVPLIVDGENVEGEFNECIEREGRWSDCYSTYVIPRLLTVDHEYLCNVLSRHDILATRSEGGLTYIGVLFSTQYGIKLSYAYIPLLSRIREREDWRNCKEKYCRLFMNLDHEVYRALRFKGEFKDESEDEVKTYRGFVGLVLKDGVYEDGVGLKVDIAE